jgi:triosephosphate isomerase
VPKGSLFIFLVVYLSKELWCKNMLKTPTIVLNVKTYSEATGQEAVQIAQSMQRIYQETNVSMAIAVQACDITQCVQNVSIPVYAQHIDPIKPGSHTGWTLPETVKAAGAVGTLINHSEHRLKLADIDICVTRAKELGLDSIVCTNNVATSKAVATFNPSMIAVEPPELIGGDVSVTTADPDIISKTVQEVRRINNTVKILCGAGVKNGKDVAKALELGANGVLLASGVVKAKNKEAVLRDLVSGIV